MDQYSNKFPLSGIIPPLIPTERTVLKKIFLLLICLVSLFAAADATPQAHTIVRRAAFDIGSGQIKMQVSDVDLKANKIVNVLLVDFAVVQLREDVAKSLDGRLSVDVQNEAVHAISELMKKAAPFHPQAHCAIATESLRLAKNSDEFIERIQNETGLSISVISQEEEGILGFISAVSAAGVDPDKTVSWDFGGGSFQITTKHEDRYVVYQERLGSTPMKNAVLAIQGKEAASPNPISQCEADQVIHFIEESLEEVPSELRQKLHCPDVVVLSVGINPLWGLEESASFDRERLAKELKARLDLEDEAIASRDRLQKQYAPRRVSNLLLVYGVMKALDIAQVHYVGTQGANAVGALLSPSYWNEE
jgi:exopolyphosphatase/guanosine-5'-triphosphate,3'-diphosphate pyrophosphatase